MIQLTQTPLLTITHRCYSSDSIIITQGCITMSDLNILLEPYELKHFTLKNRIISTAHAPAYAEEGMPKDRYQLYHEEKSQRRDFNDNVWRSSTVSPDCPPTFGQVDVSQDKVIPYFEKFSARIHQHGCKVMCQIAHHWQTHPLG